MYIKVKIFFKYDSDSTKNMTCLFQGQNKFLAVKPFYPEMDILSHKIH